MLHNDNITSTSDSKAVEKISGDEKYYRKCSFVVLYLAHPQHTKIRPTYIIANSRHSCLPTRLHSVQLKKITEDILHKIYTEEGAITGLRLVLSTLKARKGFTGI